MTITPLDSVVVGEEVQTIVSGGYQRCTVTSVEGERIELEYIRKRAFQSDAVESVTKHIRDIFLLT